MKAHMINIRTYEFETGILHLERGALTDQEALEYYEDAGKLLSAHDSEMTEKQFFALPDFNSM